MAVDSCCHFYLALHLCDCRQEQAVQETRIPAVFSLTFPQTSFVSRNRFPCRYTPLLIADVTPWRLDVCDFASCVTCRARPGPRLVCVFVPLPSSVDLICRLLLPCHCLCLVFRVFVSLLTAVCFLVYRYWCHFDELHWPSHSHWRK